MPVACAVHRQPVGERHAPAHQLEDHADESHVEPLAEPARGQVVHREALRRAVEHRDLVRQRDGEPHAILLVDANRVRIEAFLHLVQREGLGRGIELDQAALRRGRDEDVPVHARLGQRVRVRGAVVLGEILQPRCQQAAIRLARAVRDPVDGDLIRLRVDFVQPVLDVVGHVHQAVGGHQHVVHLAEDVAERPLGDRDAGKRRAPRQRFRQQLRVLAQPAVARRQFCGQRPLVLAGEPRTIALHARE